MLHSNDRLREDSVFLVDQKGISSVSEVGEFGKLLTTVEGLIACAVDNADKISPCENVAGVVEWDDEPCLLV